MHPAMDELSKLSVAERLALVQDLWDSITQSKEELPPQQWQREIAQARLAEFEGREEELGLSRDKVWEEVDRRGGT